MLHCTGRKSYLGQRVRGGHQWCCTVLAVNHIWVSVDHLAHSHYTEICHLHLFGDQSFKRYHSICTHRHSVQYHGNPCKKLISRQHLTMMTSSNGRFLFALLAICEGIHRSPVNSPNKGQWHGALMFFLICAWIKGWVNNCEADDLKRHRTHYDATVIPKDIPWIFSHIKFFIYLFIYSFIYLFILQKQQMLKCVYMANSLWINNKPYIADYITLTQIQMLTQSQMTFLNP